MTTAEIRKVPGHTIDVDVMAPGPFTAKEREAFASWYREFHGDGDLDSARFVAFWLEHWDNQVLKSFRRWVEANVQSPALIRPIGPLVMLHTYTVLGWEAGAQYELICALKFGARKSHVLETLAFGFIHAGPKGMSQVAERCAAYLRKWEDDAGTATQWPQGWSAEPEALRSGIDLRTRGMTPKEVQKLEDWYLTHQGEVPSYVPFLAKWNPEGLKAFRVRYESCIATLPKQIAPVFLLNAAAVLGKPAAMRRAAYQARHYGVKRSQVLPILGSSRAYTGDLCTEIAVDAVNELIENWED